MSQQGQQPNNHPLLTRLARRFLPTPTDRALYKAKKLTGFHGCMFLCGVFIELIKINWNPGGTNFYRVMERKAIERSVALYKQRLTFCEDAMITAMLEDEMQEARLEQQQQAVEG